MAYPNSEQQIMAIVDEHKNQDDGPLLLAIYYADPTAYSSDPEHFSSDSLFEVYAQYDRNRINSNKEMLAVVLNSLAAWPLFGGSDGIRIVVTNPRELHAAIEENWENVLPLLQAIRRDEYKVLKLEGEGERLLAILRSKQAIA